MRVKLNLFSHKFDKEYIAEIISSCSKKIFIGTDDTYDKISDIIDNQKFDKTLSGVYAG